jgi:hypothetical protein
MSARAASSGQSTIERRLRQLLAPTMRATSALPTSSFGSPDRSKPADPTRRRHTRQKARTAAGSYQRPRRRRKGAPHPQGNPGPFWVVQVDLTRSDLAGVRDEDRNHTSLPPEQETRTGQARVHRADLGDAIRAFFDHGGVTLAPLGADVEAVCLSVLGPAAAVAALESYHQRQAEDGRN